MTVNLLNNFIKQFSLFLDLLIFMRRYYGNMYCVVIIYMNLIVVYKLFCYIVNILFFKIDLLQQTYVWKNLSHFYIINLSLKLTLP